MFNLTFSWKYIKAQCTVIVTNKQNQPCQQIIFFTYCILESFSSHFVVFL